ncbi:hypothetical protein DVS28_a2685 [Euzebya pacifica]|uniref:Uncharacterized protein n=1 Tax=Euzebya pacifica TaxID=1608957 RepID=A0A346XYR7_9ACTN|nr:hypothetical protein DVS28_a2685 [Euzebya pacifica]
MQVHRLVFGTPRMTWSTCWPQPLHVVFEQFEHRAGEHMWVTSRSGVGVFGFGAG